MNKRISTAKFQANIGKVSQALFTDEKTLYIVIENRKAPERSMVVLNINMFKALLNTCEDLLIADEAKNIDRIQKSIAKNMSQSYRERGLIGARNWEELAKIMYN